MKNVQSLYYLVGLLILFFNKVRYAFTGYTTPRPFDAGDYERAFVYDSDVVGSWERYLREYTGFAEPFADRHILEVGPGADCGVGAMLIDRGASRYIAYDKFDLWSRMNVSFIDFMLGKLVSPRARAVLKDLQDGKESSIQYLAERAFSLDSVPKNTVDLVLSQAAFEHIEDVPLFFHRLTKTVKPGTILCGEIDLQTHSRWIREKDPNNIYRFPALLYRMLRYTGIPNRLRSEDYRELLVANGWKNIQIIVLRSLDEQAQAHTLRGLNKSFANKDMKLLSVMILATKGSQA